MPKNVTSESFSCGYASEAHRQTHALHRWPWQPPYLRTTPLPAHKNHQQNEIWFARTLLVYYTFQLAKSTRLLFTPRPLILSKRKLKACYCTFYNCTRYCLGCPGLARKAGVRTTDDDDPLAPVCALALYPQELDPKYRVSIGAGVHAGYCPVQHHGVAALRGRDRWFLVENRGGESLVCSGTGVVSQPGQARYRNGRRWYHRQRASRGING